jgi:hypothetical protein
MCSLLCICGLILVSQIEPSGRPIWPELTQFRAKNGGSQFWTSRWRYSHPKILRCLPSVEPLAWITGRGDGVGGRRFMPMSKLAWLQSSRLLKAINTVHGGTRGTTNPLPPFLIGTPRGRIHLHGGIERNKPIDIGFANLSPLYSCVLRYVTVDC